MYNSIIVGISMKITSKLGEIYSHSLLSKLIKKLNIFANFYRYSFVRRTLNDGKSIFENSFTYKIFIGFFGILNCFCNFLNRILREPIKNSPFLSPIKVVAKDLNSLLSFIFTFMLYCGLFTSIYGLVFSRPIKLSLIILLLGFIGASLKGLYKNILENSLFINYFTDFFKLDKEVDQWW